jgi:hypothetical protein
VNITTIELVHTCDEIFPALPSDGQRASCDSIPLPGKYQEATDADHVRVIKVEGESELLTLADTEAAAAGCAWAPACIITRLRCAAQC